MGIAIKHPVPDRVKPSFVIFDIWPLCYWEGNCRLHVTLDISEWTTTGQ